MTALYVLLFVLAIFVFANTFAWWVVFGRSGAKFNWRILVMNVWGYQDWLQKEGWCALAKRYETPDTLCPVHQALADSIAAVSAHQEDLTEKLRLFNEELRAAEGP